MDEIAAGTWLSAERSMGESTCGLALVLLRREQVLYGLYLSACVVAEAGFVLFGQFLIGYV
jgi:hypothetical protein